MRLRIAARDEIAENVIALTLRDPGGAPLPPWQPGAHIDLHLGVDRVRQYSLCGDPNDPTTYRIGILREANGGGASAHAHAHLHAGIDVEVDGPRNHFPLVEAARYVFVGGGIGITPLLPMLNAAEARGSEWRLFYGGRNRASMAFAAQLDADHGERVTLWPQEERGLLDLAGIVADAGDAVVYCCGPGPLLDAMEAACRAAKVVALHVERFAPKLSDEPGSAAEFELRLAASGRTIRVPADKSVLEAVREVGIEVLSACGEGTCGTCETRVIAGIVAHRDSILSTAERAAHATMMICVSRAAGTHLVLDL
jgi:ferredoxin-NADP reductase